MKGFLALIFLALPIISFANCIELNGSYTCEGLDGTYTLNVSTIVQDGIYAYQLTEGNDETYTFIADGMERPFEDTQYGMTFKGVISTSCNASTLVINLNGKIVGREENLELYDRFTKGSVMDPSDNKLLINSRLYENGSIVDDETDKCTRD